MRANLIGLAVLAACAGAKPYVPPVDTDRPPGDTEPELVPDTAVEDTVVVDSPVDTAPDCEALWGACLEIGELRAVCDALLATCEGTPDRPVDCVETWLGCRAGDTPVADCDLALLVCLGDTDPPEPPADTDPCDDVWATCRGAGRDTAACAEAVTACRTPDTAAPVDSDPPVDTGPDVCAVRVDACVTAGLGPGWCAWAYTGCADADDPDADACAAAFTACLAPGGDPQACLDDLIDCRTVVDTAGTCDDQLSRCTGSGAPVSACMLAYVLCTGADHAPTLECEAAHALCLADGTDPLVCDVDLDACLAALTETDAAPDTDVDCDVLYVDCLALGRSPADCDLARDACLGRP